MIRRPYYVLPAQTPIFERGGLAGLPLANEIFSTKFFDVFAVERGGIPVPQTGAIVETSSEAITGVGTTTGIGAYYLDIYSEHDNAAGSFYTLAIEGAIAQALEVGGPPTLQLAGLVILPADVDGAVRPFMMRVPVACRYFRIRTFYPATNATRFALSATLRAF